MCYDVWAVVKDPGDTGGILPVVDELRRDGRSVLLIASGKAIELLTESGREHIIAHSATDVLGSYQPPRILLTGIMSVSGGIGRDLVPLLHGQSHIVGVQEIWGTSFLVSWTEPKHRPDYIVTNDEVGRKIICAVWPDFEPARVWTTGFAALDKYASMQIETEGARARNLLGLASDPPIVLFSGQGFETAHTLREIVAVLNELAVDCYFIPRPHPRMKNNYASETKPWQQALADLHGRLIVDWFGSCTMPQLIAACAVRGVVVSMYSTTLMEAAGLRIPTIAVLYPEHGLKAMGKEYPGQKQLPLVELGCSAWAKDRDSLRACLDDALAGRLDQKAAQEKHIRVDGLNARRTAAAIAELL